MKKYQSHKVVEAAPIVAAEFQEDGSGQVWIRDPAGPGNLLVSVPTGFKRPNTAPSMSPDGGDYLVRYQPDGYLSWSPKAVFEAGYREIGDTDLAPAALSAVLGPTPAAVEVTVAAPAGKRAIVVTQHAQVGSSTLTVTGGQSQTVAIEPGDIIVVSEGAPHSTVAHKRDNG